ncbi:TerB family tellurite resistance protein [Hoeflea sp.]|uniref:tellurite resistance TerB family protein n=1 Tax=Hoeflea sp. TaxID=1940281 RepID=UPI003A90E658
MARGDALDNRLSLASFLASGESSRPEGAFVMKGLFAAIAQMVERKPPLPGALGQLSENPVAMAEILLLFRMVLADGIVQPSQLTAFERICEQHFGISPRDMPELHALLDSPKARSCEAEAFTLLGQLDTGARTTLLEAMVRIADANAVRDERDDKLIRRIAHLLGLEPGVAAVKEQE